MRGWLGFAVFAALMAVGCGRAAPDVVSPPKTPPRTPSSGEPTTTPAIDFEWPFEPGTDEGTRVPPTDLLERLAALPYVASVVENPTTRPGYRLFALTLHQPVDHHAPGGAGFTQRATLLHRSEDAPTVLYSTGHALASEDRRAELTALLEANQLTVEHRYYGSSRPEPTDWGQLTVSQAAADLHRFVGSFKTLYRGRWLSAGTGKGGLTALLFRRFYPSDVEGTVAYVAPLLGSTRAERFEMFLDAVGPDEHCRRALADLQRAALEARPALVQALAERASASGELYERLGLEKALEHTVLELPFAFWQYHGVERCTDIPDAQADAATVLGFLEDIVGLHRRSDTFIAANEPFFYQAGTQLGFAPLSEGHILDLLRFPGTHQPQTYAPAGTTLSLDERAMQDLDSWVRTQAQRVLFVYGQNDPWSAAMFDLGEARTSFRFVVPEANHAAQLSQLPEAERERAFQAVREWAGVDPLLLTTETETLESTALRRPWL